VSAAPQLIFNQRLDAVLVGFFAVLMWIIIFDMIRVCWRVKHRADVLPSAESPYVLTQLGN
jgi:carbon starvation protein